jgi:hypothetical protein
MYRYRYSIAQLVRMYVYGTQEPGFLSAPKTIKFSKRKALIVRSNKSERMLATEWPNTAKLQKNTAWQQNCYKVANNKNNFPLRPRSLYGKFVQITRQKLCIHLGGGGEGCLGCQLTVHSPPHCTWNRVTKKLGTRRYSVVYTEVNGEGRTVT